MLVLQDILKVKNLNGLTNEKVPCIYACYALDERSSFSQITISQEDYDKLPGETRTQIEKITTEKAIKVKSRKFLSMQILVRKLA